MSFDDVAFRVSKDELAGALSWVVRSLAPKPTQPILRGVLIDALDEGLLISGFDYEVSTKVRINAEVTQTGRMLVAAKLLNDIVASMPNKPVDVRLDGSKILLECGASHFELPAMTVEDYPLLPNLPEMTGQIDAGAFSEAIAQVGFAAATGDSMPMLTGVYLQVEGNNMTAVATDRFRLAIKEVNWSPTDTDIDASVLVPAKTLNDLARSIGHGTTETVGLAFGNAQEVGKDGLLGISTDNRQTTARLIDAEFPKYRPLIPKEHKTLALVDIATLQDALRRVSLVAGDKTAQVRMTFDGDELRLSAGGAEAGQASETLPAEVHGDPITIAFTSTYLKEGLNALSTSRACFCFTVATRSAVLISEPDVMPDQTETGSYVNPETDFIYILMPVRLPG